MKKETCRLKNGLVVIAIKKSKIPIAYFKLVVKRGAIDDPPDLRGTSYLTAKLLNEGTATKDALTFAQEVEKLGGSINARSGYSISTIEADSLSDNIFSLLELTRELLIEPGFREKDLKRLKKQIKTGFLLRFQDPNYVSLFYFTRYMYKHYPPLSTLPEGTPDYIEKIERKNIVDFHLKHYSPENAFLVVVSDLEPSLVFEKTEKILGSWTGKGERVQKELPDIPDHKEPMIYIVDMDVTQSHIKIGKHTISRSHPDYNALRVANYILGGSDLSSRLMRTIRIEKGFAYSVYSSITPGYPTLPTPLRGSFYVSMETSTENTRKAFDLVFKEIEKVKKEGFLEEEIKEAKSFYHGNIPLRSATYEQLAVLAMDEELFKLPWKHWVKDVEEIEKLSKEKIEEAARKHLDMEKYVAVIVGKADKLLPEFKDLRVEVIKPDY